MRSDRKVLVAFLLNLTFSILEFIGGAITSSVAITSDALHDLGDAISIGLSYFMEKRSKRNPDKIYTYGYARYSVLGSLITIGVLIAGSIIVIYNAILRLINPVEINYNGMLILAVIGLVINSIAVFATRGGDSLNVRSVNLHMLEDVLGWLVVLVGAVIIKFTRAYVVDPIMSIAVAGFILFSAVSKIREVLDLFLVRIPRDIDIEEIKDHVLDIEGVQDVHHIHIWSLDGHNNYATMHVMADQSNGTIKGTIRGELKEHGIGHVTLEIEAPGEICHDEVCIVRYDSHSSAHHHHHHH